MNELFNDLYRLSSTKRRIIRMKKDDIITLPTGENVRIVSADLTKYKNIIVIEREDLERRVVDRETMTITKAPNLSAF